MALPDRVCAKCEKLFTPKTYACRYCSKPCKDAAYYQQKTEYKRRRRKLLTRKNEELSDAERDHQASVRKEERGWPACKFCTYCMDMSWRRPENKPCPGCAKLYAPRQEASYDPDSVLRGTYDWC